MLRFKEFLESLNREQKSKLGILWNEEPSFSTQELHKHVFGEHSQRIIPLNPDHDTKTQVSRFLGSNGYDESTLDWKKGKIKEKTEYPHKAREFSVGSLLKNPKNPAPDHLIKSFDNDDKDSNITPDTHSIVYSIKPEHIGEISTQKKWRSCASLTPKGNPTSDGNGAAAKKLYNAIISGSAVAYVVPNKKIEEAPSEMNNAVSRVLVHPYTGTDENGEEHTIFRRELKNYGKKDSGFHKTLDEFLEKNYPAKEGVLYYKIPDIYDDDKVNYRLNHSFNSLSKLVTSPKYMTTHLFDAFRENKLSHQQIKHILNIQPPKTENGVRNLNSAKNGIAESQKLNNENFDNLLDRHSYLLNNKNLSKIQRNKLLDKMLSDDNVRKSDNTLSNIVDKFSDILKPHHVDSIINKYMMYYKNSSEDLPHDSFNIDSLLNLKHKGLLNHEHFNKLKTSNNYAIHKSILDYPNSYDEFFKERTGRPSITIKTEPTLKLSNKFRIIDV